MSRQAGLGRGLGALMPAATPGRSGLMELPLRAIVANPRQPRRHFAPEPLAELAASLRQVGMLQPILVRPRADGRYEIVAGERRFRAAQEVGLDPVPAVVRATEDAQVLTEALVENLHRADLSPLEEASAYDQLLSDFGLTHDGLASRLGKSRSAVSNTLRLLALPQAVQDLVTNGALSAGHAKALLALPEAEQQVRLSERVVLDGLSVRQTERAVRALLDSSQGRRPGGPSRGERARLFGGLERRLTDALATSVTITGSTARGRVVIDYSGRADLERLLAILGRGVDEDFSRESS